jgi:hypothetical protein
VHVCSIAALDEVCGDQVQAVVDLAGFLAVDLPVAAGLALSFYRRLDTPAHLLPVAPDALEDFFQSARSITARSIERHKTTFEGWILLLAI